MAGKPQVTLTFAGDSSKLEKAFEQVGSSAKSMGSDVGKASKDIGDGFGKADTAAGETYDKFDALESVGRGTTDTMSGIGEIMKGNVLQGATDLAGGVAALADGFSGALLPALKAAASGGIANAAASAKQTVASVGQKAATIATTAATKAATAGQWALNVAMRANPIGLVITALTLLVGGFILAYKKSETFRNIVNGVFGAVKKAAGAVASFFTDTVWPKIQGAWNGISSGVGTAKDKIVGVFNTIVDFVKGVPGKIGGFFKGVGTSISAPFRAAFQAIKDFWNNNVGGKGFTVPGWIPNIGGKEFRIPYFHTGGIVSGAMGSETLAVLKAGERVTGGSNTPAKLPPSGDFYITVEMDGQQFDARIKSVTRDSNRQLKRTVKAA